jgi:hypothetical protein
MKVISDKDRFVMELNIGYINTYDSSLINSEPMPVPHALDFEIFCFRDFLKAVGKT